MFDPRRENNVWFLFQRWSLVLWQGVDLHVSYPATSALFRTTSPPASTLRASTCDPGDIVIVWTGGQPGATGLLKCSWAIHCTSQTVDDGCWRGGRGNITWRRVSEGIMKDKLGLFCIFFCTASSSIVPELTLKLMSNPFANKHQLHSNGWLKIFLQKTTSQQTCWGSRRTERINFIFMLYFMGWRKFQVWTHVNIMHRQSK